MLRPAAGILIAVVATIAACGPSGELPRVGKRAPDFRLPAHDGSTVGLTDFEGHWVVLFFYPRDGTTGSALEVRNFQRDLAKFRERQTFVVGIGMEDAASHRAFASRESLDFPLLSDVDGAVSQAYGSMRGAGNVRMSQRNTFVIAPDGTIAKVYESPTINSHSRTVLADIRRYQGG